MGRNIWITGAGTGIGKAIAHEYANSGNTLILSGRTRHSLEQVADELKNKECNTQIQLLDISKEDEIQAVVDQVIEENGRIDVLVNNAGLSQRSVVIETQNEVGRTLMEVNFFGTVHLTKAVLPYMLKANSGSIVVISSAAGKFGFHRRSYYSASKHALHGFFDSLSLELHKTNINVLLVCPGRISTNFSFSALKGDGEPFDKMDHRLKGGVSPESCAKRVKRAEEKRKKEIYLGGQEVLMIYIKRLFPALYRYIGARVKVH